MTSDPDLLVKVKGEDQIRTKLPVKKFKRFQFCEFLKQPKKVRQPIYFFPSSFFVDPRSGMEKKPDPGKASRIRNFAFGRVELSLKYFPHPTWHAFYLLFIKGIDAAATVSVFRVFI